ncbi:hypothetical protein FJZ31_05430 [Candidatus Poribacteria bacterium]|nr:hypothetical protein [Candidatus Poribacteria bacterium]
MFRTRKKLYLNENISHKLIALPLRELGYDVISSHEAGMDKLDDYSQLTFSARRRRILVTFNRDDFERLHERMIRSKQSHFGILHSEVINSSELVDRLRKFWDDSSITMQQMKNEIRALDNWK